MLDAVGETEEVTESIAELEESESFDVVQDESIPDSVFNESMLDTSNIFAGNTTDTVQEATDEFEDDFEDAEPADGSSIFVNGSDDFDDF